MEIFAWYNLIFLLPLAAGILMVLGSAMGLGGGDTPAEAGHDFGHDVGHDADGDAGSDTDGRGIHALDDTGGHGHETGLLMRMFSVLGIGRVPLSIVMMVGALIFGGIGICANILLRPVLATPFLYVWISLGAAGFGMVVLTGGFARLVHRFMPTSETTIVRKADLVGRTGTLVYGASSDSGAAQVNDKMGNLHQVMCRTRGGELPKGTEVLIVEYLSEQDRFVVEANPLRRTPVAAS